MKVLVIGCTHAGTAAIKNIVNLYPDAKVTVYERNDNISFLSCGIALYVGGVVKDAQSLFYSSPKELQSLGVDAKMLHDVLSVDLEKKEVRVKNLKTNEEFNDNFDKLIVTTGSWPVIPKIQGIDLENVILCKNYDHSKEIVRKAKEANSITVVGAGYIGVELVEAFESYGKKVTLIDSLDRSMNKYFDKEFTDIAESRMRDNGIKLAFGETVERFEGKNNKVTKVITNKNTYETDLVILAIGFRPNTDLLKGQLDMLQNGAIIVDEYMRTSKEDVFAAGDSCAVIYNPTNTREYIPLATNAVRMGTLIAHNLVNPKIKYLGTQATSGIKIYDCNFAATGLTEQEAVKRGIDVSSVTIEENNRPEFMPTYDKVVIKAVFEKESRKIVGAQIFSNGDYTAAINTLSVAIQNKMTIDELGFVDFFFQPHYNKPWNYLNTLGLSALEN